MHLPWHDVVKSRLIPVRKCGLAMWRHSRTDYLRSSTSMLLLLLMMTCRWIGERRLGRLHLMLLKRRWVRGFAGGASLGCASGEKAAANTLTAMVATVSCCS
jgi:hypothetical protein